MTKLLQLWVMCISSKCPKSTNSMCFSPLFLAMSSQRGKTQKIHKLPSLSLCLPPPPSTMVFSKNISAHQINSHHLDFVRRHRPWAVLPPAIVLVSPSLFLKKKKRREQKSKETQYKQSLFLFLLLSSV